MSINVSPAEAGSPARAGSPVPAGAHQYRFFWQPGCSSCVRVKELLTELGVDFDSINILERDGAVEELRAKGIRSVPVLFRGSEMLFTQSLQDVANFVGADRTFKRLPPNELIERWNYFLDTAKGLIRQVPPDQLETRPIPERPRTVCNLSYHIFQVPEGFLGVLQEGKLDSSIIDNSIYDHLKTIDDILGYADGIQARLKDWWTTLEDKSGQQKVKIYYGTQPLHTILERGTWHSAQHTRQLNHVLDGFGVKVERPIDKAKYEGLPMPEAIWA